MIWFGLLFLFVMDDAAVRCDSDWFYATSTTTSPPPRKNSYNYNYNEPQQFVVFANNDQSSSPTRPTYHQQFAYNQYNYYNIQSYQPPVEETPPNACPALEGLCFCSTRIAGIFCSSNITSAKQQPIKFGININSNAFSIGYFLIVGQEGGKEDKRLELRGNEFDLGNLRLSAQFNLVIDRVASIALDTPFVRDPPETPAQHDRRLYLDNFDLNFKYQGKPLNGQKYCWNASGIGTNRTFLSGFDQMHIGFSSQTSYIKDLCPWIFHNVLLQGLYLYNQTFDDGFKFMTPPSPHGQEEKVLKQSLNSSIQALYIDSSVIDVNEQFLSKHVFKDLKRMFIKNSLINSIDLKLLVDRNRTESLEYVEMSVQDFAFFLDYQHQSTAATDYELLAQTRKKPLTNSTSRSSLTLVLKEFESDYICLLKNMADHIVSLQQKSSSSGGGGVSEYKTVLVRIELDEVAAKTNNCSCNLNQYLMAWSADNAKNMIALSFKLTDHRQEAIKCTRKQPVSEANRCDIGSIISRSCAPSTSKKPPSLSASSGPLAQGPNSSSSSTTTTGASKTVKNSSPKIRHTKCHFSVALHFIFMFMIVRQAQ